MKQPFLFFVMLGFLLTVPFISSFAQVGINTDNSSPDPSSILDLKSTSQGVLIPRMTQSERNSIATPANGLMIYQTDQTAGFYYFNGTVWTSMAGSGSSHYVGELFGGGIVFWVDHTGQHGQIVSLLDISSSVEWSTTYSVTGATSFWNGQGNSATISGISPAAQLCSNYTNSANYGTGTYSDWYLPAIDQLNLIYQSRYILNKNIESIAETNIFGIQVYWSSTEGTSNFAWSFPFEYGFPDGLYDKFGAWPVRAVRNF